MSSCCGVVVSVEDCGGCCGGCCGGASSAGGRSAGLHTGWGVPRRSWRLLKSDATETTLPSVYWPGAGVGLVATHSQAAAAESKQLMALIVADALWRRLGRRLERQRDSRSVLRLHPGGRRRFISI